jgi:cytochrome c oxidase assembly protein subunit 11
MSRRAWAAGALALCAALAVGGGAFLWTHTGSDAALSRSVTVRFAVASEPGLDWRFEPEQPEMTLRLGQTGLAFFKAVNPTGHTVGGHASYSVTPAAADPYLVRVACLCASQQVLAPHEQAQIPMTFYVDPAMAQDAAMRDTRVITLSYRFVQTALPQTEARLVRGSAKTKVN